MKNKQIIPYGAIRSQLRRLWLYSAQRQEAIKRCKVSRGKYKCEYCGKVNQRKELQAHHIKPIGKITTWDKWITDLFCNSKDLKVICKKCHLKEHGKNGKKKIIKNVK